MTGPMICRCLLVLPLFLAPALAQGGRGGEAVVKPKPVSQAEAGEVSDSGDAVIQPPGDNKPDLSAPAGPRRGASTFCQFHVHTRPSKLMPGQTGTLIVTAVLRGDAVLQAPAPLELQSPAQQNVLTLGAPSFAPAAPGRLAKAYLGRPVYDNYAILELPVTVAPTAVVGTKPAVVLEFEFDLFDGNTAQSIGRFADRASGFVEIGQALDPAVRGGYTPPIAVDDAPPPPVSRPQNGDDAPEAKEVERPAAVGGATPPPAEMSTPAEVAPAPAAAPREGDMPVLAEDPGLPWALLAGGGALVLLVLMLAVRRR